MSRFFFFVLIIVSLAGCGLKEEQGQIDEVRKFEPISISENDYRTVLRVCDALRGKEAILQQMVDNRVPFAFNYGEKNCSEESIKSFDPITVRIKNNAQDFQFDVTNGNFGYSNVETTKVGLMVDICNNLASKVSPIVGASGSAIWFAPIFASKICQSSPDETCMLVEFGRKTDQQGSYRIHTREWVKFNVTKTTKQGFFSERKTFSTIGCPQGTQIEKSAKSI